MSKYNGKELKDEFAMEAMKEMIEASMVGNIKFNDWEHVAKDCYDIAEAMIEERNHRLKDS